MKQHDLITHQSTPWYKHILFLILLNIISLLTIYFLLVFVLKLTLDNTFTFYPLVTSIGAIYGGVLGYTLWATTDNFPVSRALAISTLWAVTLVSIAFMGIFLLCISVGLLAFAFLVTLGLLEKWDQGWSIFKATFSSIFIIAIVASYISLDVLDITPVSLAILTYSTTLVYLLKRQNESLRHENAKRAQRQQRQDDLSAGLLPEGEYTVGDDGELIPVDEAHNNHKAQS